MKFDLTIGLADRPGQLLKALKPIAKNGGNIISIIHERENPSAGFVPVSLVVDFPSRWNMQKTIDDLRKMEVTIIKAEEIVETVHITAILVGRADLKRVIQEGLRNAKIVGFEASALTSKDACLKLEIEVPTDLLDETLENLRRVAESEGSLIILPI